MSESDSEEEYKLPWPAYEKYFESKGPTTKGKKNISVQCKLCLPRLKIISVSGTSSSNIRKHLQSIHPSQLATVEKHVKEFNNKRKCDEGKSSEQIKFKQSKLDFTNTMRAAPSQATVDAAVIKYVVDGGQPFRVVDETYFINFVNALHPSAKVMCRQTLVTRLNEAFRTMKLELSEKLEMPDYVCTTADCWTAHRRSFIGITAHWIDNVSLIRKSASLACRRITGSHTFDKLAEEMQSIFKEYKIQNKLIKTVTDNGSNFVKAFRMFMGPSEEEGSDTDEIELEPVAITEMLADGANDAIDAVAYLPPHQRCASHTLNLVATTDASKALEADKGYKKMHRSSFAKCQSLWNKQNQSGQASDCIKEKLGRYFVCPNATRWNSTYNAMSCIDKILDEKRAQLDNVCDQLRLPSPRILPGEHNFIKEYCTVMGKVANALDILQGENYMYMAFYTPTIIKLKASLESVKDLRYCQPLVEAVLRGVERRFECIYDDENVMAAMLHPFFKLDWTYMKQDANRKQELINKLAREMEKNTNDDVSLPPATQVAQEEVEPEYNAVLNFFHDEDDDITDTNQMNHMDDLNKYFSSKNKALSSLNEFPSIKQLFIKYNTAIPSSAPVERLFSTGKAVFSDKRACLSDNNFEMHLLLKVNNRLLV